MDTHQHLSVWLVVARSTTHDNRAAACCRRRCYQLSEAGAATRGSTRGQTQPPGTTRMRMLHRSMAYLGPPDKEVRRVAAQAGRALILQQVQADRQGTSCMHGEPGRAGRVGRHVPSHAFNLVWTRCCPPQPRSQHKVTRPAASQSVAGGG